MRMDDAETKHGAKPQRYLGTTEVGRLRGEIDDIKARFNELVARLEDHLAVHVPTKK